MNIIITPGVTLEEVQKIFSGKFPLLSLRFFETAVSYVSGKTMEGKRIEDNAKTFDEYNPHIKNVCIAITPETKVNDLERSFHEKLGIFAQVYRQSGNIWLQTTATDSMTLAEVEQLSEMMKEDIKKDEKEDYHEQL